MQVRQLKNRQAALEGENEELASRERQATALAAQLQSRLKSQDKQHRQEVVPAT